MTERTLGADIVDLVDVDALRREVQHKYREVAENPLLEYHFTRVVATPFVWSIRLILRTSTSGPAESPEPCRVQDGRR